MLIDAGAQDTAVVVLSLFTVIVFEAVGPLPLWFASPAYVPLTVAVPGATPVKVTVQVPDAPRVQLAPTVPTAVFDDVKLTVTSEEHTSDLVSLSVIVRVVLLSMMINAIAQHSAVVLLCVL